MYTCHVTQIHLLFPFAQGVSRVAAVSLQIGYPTVASVPHSIVNGFKVCINASID